MRKTPNEKIEELQAAKAKIQARIQTEKSKLRKKQRKEDARKKIIIGAVVMAHAEHDDIFAEKLLTLLDEHTLRPADRELLGLEPLGSNDISEN